MTVDLLKPKCLTLEIVEAPAALFYTSAVASCVGEQCQSVSDSLDMQAYFFTETIQPQMKRKDGRFQLECKNLLLCSRNLKNKQMIE